MNKVDAEKNLSHTVVNRETEHGEWRYVETAHGAEVEAGAFSIRLHWKGTADVADLRAVARLIAAAPSLLKACRGMQASLDGSPTDFAGMLNAHRQLDSAVNRALNQKN